MCLNKLDRRSFLVTALAFGLGLPSALTLAWYTHDNGFFPRNRNGDFCYGDLYWHPEHEVPELGYRHGLPSTGWGSEIRTCRSGSIWIDNPDVKLWDHVSLVQYSFQFPPTSQWTLANNHLVLEADVMIPEPDVLHTSDPSTSWNRAAIALQLKRTDGHNYLLEEGKDFSELYSEFDFFRHNTKYFHTAGSNVYEYHADQLEPGEWSRYRIDLNGFLRKGYENQGGWADSLLESTYLSAWYLVVEALGSRLSAAWRNVILRNYGEPVSLF